MPQIVVSTSELLGKIDLSAHSDFVKIDAKYTNKDNIYMREQAYDAFKQMFDSAKEAGISLQIISAARSFEHQRQIWESKWSRSRYMGWSKIEKAKDIMTYSSMPGTSRHHWGTDIDLNSLENTFFEAGEGKLIYDWLAKHGGKFGFAQTYTSKESGRTGYEEEKWHWSYLPLSQPLLKRYKEEVNYEHIEGFKGAEVAREVRAIEDYVMGVER